MTEAPDRRDLLRVLAAGSGFGLAGCLDGGTESRTTTSRVPATPCDGWAGTDSSTGEDSPAVTVAVGVRGSLSFDPADVTVRVGDTVRWEWYSENHNIVVEEQPERAEWSGTGGDSTRTYDAPHTYEHTFTNPGTYEYYCTPHLSAGMEAKVQVESRERNCRLLGENVPARITVGGNGLTFDPGPSPTPVVPADTTVTFHWESDNHNIVVDEAPEASSWEGHEPTESAGFTHSHTFTTRGRYEYYCEPHESVGMEGAFVVVDDVEVLAQRTASTERQQDDSSDRVVLGENAPAFVEVGPGGNTTIEPGTDEVPIVRPGTEVTFIWRSDGHALVIDERPPDGSWNGHDWVEDDGFETAHTFEAEGTYKYHCRGHGDEGATAELRVESKPSQS